MTVERRLQHAARDLRAVAVEVPPLDDLTHPPRPAPTTRPRPLVTALAAPLLFVAGGLLAIGVMQPPDRVQVRSDIGRGVEVGSDDGVGTATVGVAAPSVHDEALLIARIIETAPEPPAEATPLDTTVAASGPS